MKNKKIRVKICEAKDWECNGIKDFKSYQEMIEFMKKKFDSWIIDFDFRDNKNFDCKLTIYNDYVE